MSSESARSDYIEFLDGTIAWFKRHADRVRIFYNVVRAALVLLSAALPALTANHLTLLSTIVAVIVAALAGIDAQFKPGEQWKHHRSIQLMLMRMKREYEVAASSRSGEGAAFSELQRSVENLLGSESSDYWALRIAPWPAQPK